jgi:hypothetical protein
MKKVILSVAVAILGIVSVNAQFYIGGSLGYSSSTTKPEKGDKVTSYSYSIAPAVGYRFNDKLDLGIFVSVQNSASKTLMLLAGESIVPKTQTHSFTIAPYLRYSLFKFHKFNVLESATIFAGKTETEIETHFITVNVTEAKYISWGANIYPTVIYDLSNKVALFSNLNFLKFGFMQTNIKDGDTTTDFGFAFNADDILPAIGIMYKF